MKETTNRKRYKNSILLILLSFCLFVTSCGFENEYSEGEGVSRPPLNSVSEAEGLGNESEEPLKDIEGYNYNGKSFVVATTDGEFWKNDAVETLLGKAVSERNDMVEKKLNISIEVKVESAEEMLENVKTAVSKGEHYADLLVAPANVLAELVAEGCLLNINTLPYVDHTAEYYNKTMAEASQINGKLYLLFGELTQTEYSSWCVFYNEEMAKEAGTDPYELYEKGEWTWDAFLDYSKKMAEFTESGFVTTVSPDELINVLWATSGNKFFGECAWTSLSVPSMENGKAVLSNIRKIIKSGTLGKQQGNDALTAFTSMRSGMILCRRNAVYSICESGMDWNAVPMPKMDSESGHYSFVDGEALAAAVPANVEDSNFTGRVLNVLLASSGVVSQGVENNELYYYWSDNRMAVAMNETKKYTYIDIAIIYASAVKDIATVTTENIKTAYDAGISPFQFYHSTKRQFELYASENFG